MSVLTSDQILRFRTGFIRDRYDAGPPVVTLSHYNRALRANFFTDEQLQQVCDRLEVDYAEELEGVYDTKHAERQRYGDSDADAVTSATAQREEALFRLMRAECRMLMMEDPGFIGSYTDAEHRKAMIETWRVAIDRDRTFVRGRTSAAFAAVELVRL
jgi:hypothetical protein